MRRTVLLPLLAVVAVLPARADTVRLRNGRAYEGVIAERTAAGVEVHLGIGQLVIPDDQVVAIEKAPSALASYLSRRAALEAAPEASAADWLALARWAKVHDLATPARQAALVAADLDPRLPGLDAVLRPLGLVFDESQLRWIPYEEAMARRGMVRYEGEWMAVAEQRDRIDARERRRAAQAREEASWRMAAAAVAMRASEDRLAERQETQLEADLAGAYVPVFTFPGFWIPPVIGIHQPHQGHRPPEQPQPRQRQGHELGNLQGRQPGSFLPADGVIVPPEMITPPPPRASSRSGRS